MYAFIINAKAGGGRAGKVRPIVERFMTEAGLGFSIHETRSAEEATIVSRDEAAGGHTVVAVGGDGSIHHVFSGLVTALNDGSVAPVLGVLPVGTGNDLARMLGLPDRIEDALALLIRGDTRRIDYGTVEWNGSSGFGRRPFINVAGIGLDAKAALLAVKLKPFLGNLCYTVAPALSVWTWNSPEARIEASDDTGNVFRWNGRFLLASVANGKWVGGGITISPEALIDDRHLDLCLIRATNPVRALTILPRAVKGRHTHLPEVAARPFQTLAITVSRPSPIHLDGEPCTRDAEGARFDVSAGQITVFAPMGAGSRETM